MKNKRISTGRTREIYEDDSYAKECDAKVLECREIFSEDNDRKGYGIVLNQTVFFPEGGGQPADEGVFFVDGDCLQVFDVQKKDGVILHYVEKPLETGSSVTAKIDWTLRYERMQNHSGEHLFCGLIHKLYGYENVGFHMSKDCVTVDVNGVLTADDMEKLEKLSNEGVDANSKIEVVYPEFCDEIEYRSKLELLRDIRVVLMEGYDACACCAPHVKSTGEIGLIKVIDFMSHRGGTRFTLKSGKWARADYGILHREITQTMRLFSAKREACDLAAERVSEQLKAQQETITLLKKQITDLYKDKLREAAARQGENKAYMMFDPMLDEVQMRTLVNEGVMVFAGLVAGFMGKDGEGYRYIIGKNETMEELDLREFAKEMNRVFNGRGGGSDKMIQGSIVANREDIETYFNQLK